MSNERYELRRMPLARGVMGEVWLGWDRVLGREVAVKFPRVPAGADLEEMVRYFWHEVRITARLRQPGVPEVLDTGVEDGRPYLVMRRVRGSSVSDLLATHGRLPEAEAAAVAARVCSVLMGVHDASLVHRDVKPANLMVEPDGTVTLVDFGLAVCAGSGAEWPGNVIGTPAYMAPEQWLMATSSPRSDLYALGCTLHEMLTGLRPDELPRADLGARPGVSTRLSEVLGALLAPDPHDRPASARTARAALLPFCDEDRLPLAEPVRRQRPVAV